MVASLCSMVGMSFIRNCVLPSFVRWSIVYVDNRHKFLILLKILNIFSHKLFPLRLFHLVKVNGLRGADNLESAVSIWHELRERHKIHPMLIHQLSVII